MSGFEIASKWPGKCGVCGQRYAVGERVSKGKDGKWGHARCINGSGGSTKAQALVVEPAPAVVDEKPFEPSNYQAGFYDFIQNGSGNCVLIATAGSGKTTTVRHAVPYMPTGAKVAAIAFNKRNAADFKRVMPKGVFASTFHSLGLKNAKKMFPDLKVEEYKSWKLMDQIVSRQPIYASVIESDGAAIRQIVELSKSTLSDDLPELAERYGVSFENEAGALEVAGKVLALSRADTSQADFGDMLYWCAIDMVPCEQFDFFLQDECLPYKTPVLMADGSSVEIGKLVEEKSQAQVLAYNLKTGKQEARRITAWHQIPNQKPLVKVSVRQTVKVARSYPGNFVVCTIDHKIWTQRGWVMAGNLVPGDIVQVETSARKSPAYQNTGAVQNAAVCVKAVEAFFVSDGDCPVDARVVSVEPVTLPDYFVYDIAVDGCHDFYANGILVHNCQDATQAQIEVSSRSLAPGGRLLAVGDPRQAIYGWAGSAVDSMDQITRHHRAINLPLSVTYRLPASHVRYVNQKFPGADIQARPNAPDGEIADLAYGQMIHGLRGGDLVVCRVNAPLVEPAFELIRQGRKAVILGRNIGKGLDTLLSKIEKRSHSTDTRMVIAALRAYTEKEVAKLEAAKKNNQASTLFDQCETLIALSDGCDNTFEIHDKIDEVFSDDNQGVVFSSVHRAKGSEADNVYILRRDLMPHPMAKEPWQQVGEQNCLFVALTRSKHGLYFVNDN